MNRIKILEDLVRFNTIKDKENKLIINYIEEYLKQCGFRTEYKDRCLIMSIKENYKLGFVGHTDTVEYIQGWNSNPFELTNINGKLYGLGACDMKGGIAAMLNAISETNFSNLKYGMKVYFTYDEEIGFSGIKSIVNRKEEFPNNIIVGEPTDNFLIIGSKGLLEYKIKFNGIKVHSSNPEKGKNAINECIDFLSDFNKFYETIKIYKEEKYEVPYTTMNIGTIKGGSAINSTASNCEILVDFRVVNNEHIQLIQKNIKQLSKKYDMEYEILNCIKPFINKEEINDNNEKDKIGNYITEASFINSKNKIILGPGPITAHEINEYITEKSFNDIIEEYKKIINNKCYGYSIS